MYLKTGPLADIKQSTVNLVVDSDKRFNDVHGVDESVEEVKEVVMYLKDPSKFTKLGGKLPTGVLLTGPPGTGKTLLARAIAGEAGVPFFYASGSDFDEMFVGVGARRVRDLFEQAKKKAPCIVFIDEIDAVGGKRNTRDVSANKMTLNQLLVDMDGFAQNSGVIVIAATNFPESLDQALLRPGRFDRHVVVPLPDVGGRRAILEHYLSTCPKSDDVDINTLARGTPGMSGADLANLVNEAAIKASIDSLGAVTMSVLEFAKDKILMGAERKSALITPQTARMTAYHEGGHALMALLTPGAMPVYKATIMPRGQSLGHVSQLPEGDQTSVTYTELLARLDVAMGGRVAEELVYGPASVTTGASSDLQAATDIARRMVTKWGMSNVVGPMVVNEENNMSSETRAKVETEIQRLLSESYARATNMLTSHRRDLDTVAKSLITYETLSGEELKKLLKGQAIARMSALDTKKESEAKKVEEEKKLKAASDAAAALQRERRWAAAAAAAAAAEKKARAKQGVVVVGASQPASEEEAAIDEKKKKKRRRKKAAAVDGDDGTEAAP